MLIELVIILTIGGQDVERRVPIPTMAECWEQAASRMTDLRRLHGDKIESIGVGCVVNAGSPA